MQEQSHNLYQSQKACLDESHLNVYYFIARKYYLHACARNPLHGWNTQHFWVVLAYLFDKLLKKLQKIYLFDKLSDFFKAFVVFALHSV